MATEQKLQVVSLPANTDLSAKQYYIASLTNASGTAQVSVAGVDSFIVGVIQNDANAQGRACEVGTEGISKVICGASVTAADTLTADTNGKAITRASGDAYALGKALTSGSSGDIISVLIRPTGTA
jgi:hypothetical protein